MKHICSAHRSLGIALLLIAGSTGLMAQTEVASTTMPHDLPAINSALRPTDIAVTEAVPGVARVEAPVPNSDRPNHPTVAPGTLATNSAPTLKPGKTSSFSVVPDSLPSWEINSQPLAYMRYGAAPAVVTLHIGSK